MGMGTVLYMYDVVVKKFMFAISSPDEFLGTVVSIRQTPLFQDNLIKLAPERLN